MFVYQTLEDPDSEAEPLVEFVGFVDFFGVKLGGRVLHREGTHGPDVGHALVTHG